MQVRISCPDIVPLGVSNVWISPWHLSLPLKPSLYTLPHCMLREAGSICRKCGNASFLCIAFPRSRRCRLTCNSIQLFFCSTDYKKSFPPSNHQNSWSHAHVKTFCSIWICIKSSTHLNIYAFLLLPIPSGLKVLSQQEDDMLGIPVLGCLFPASTELIHYYYELFLLHFLFCRGSVRML